jgi:signal peptidase I
MLFLRPRHVKQGREMAKDARKMLAYKRDIWPAGDVAQFEEGIRKLEAATRSGAKDAIESAALELDRLAGKHAGPSGHSALREHCEVILVAIAVALGVRTYFLQPFTIPTGSMQPTLNGIIGYKTAEPPPNVAVRLFQKLAWGRTWINVVAQSDDVITEVRESKALGIFSSTLLVGRNQTYRVMCPQETLFRYLMPPLREFKAGDVIARGYFETGDHVFVDMASYHFRKPKRGEVFVFNTKDIPTRDNRNSLMQGPSQFFIKRLAGIPGDTLQIIPPRLLVNGQVAEGAQFAKVMSVQNGYRGYSNESEGQPDAQGRAPRYRMNLLGAPKETFHLDSKSEGAAENNYFALGDNSFLSSDSRDWGPVPEKNLVGRGILVYWPFTRHWGLIR